MVMFCANVKFTTVDKYKEYAMAIILPFPKTGTQHQSNFPPPAPVEESYSVIGYQEFKSLMRQNAVTFFKEGGRFTTTSSIPIERTSDMNRRAPGEDRVEWHLSPVDYIYWFLTHKPGCGLIQLSDKFDSLQFNVRYDEEAFTPAFATARTAFFAKQRGLSIANPSSTEAAQPPAGQSRQPF